MMTTLSESCLVHLKKFPRMLQQVEGWMILTMQQISFLRRPDDLIPPTISSTSDILGYNDNVKWVLFDSLKNKHFIYDRLAALLKEHLAT